MPSRRKRWTRTSSTADGTPIQQYDCGTGANQQFRMG
jgi:hypothetical protein